MSDNDLIYPNLDELIRRGDAMEAVENEAYLIGAMDSLWDGSFKRTKRAAVRVIAGVPAVPHEMSAREFLRDFHRLCQSMRCDECPITHDGEPRTCAVLMGCFPDETIETVEQWAREHPERSGE